ncbi:hypothetical protein BCEP4_390005 [Burkholderia cepacia]|nr:hypothetical protein BCEP4_390005 [Burkholderia cepacia]
MPQWQAPRASRAPTATTCWQNGTSSTLLEFQQMLGDAADAASERDAVSFGVLNWSNQLIVNGICEPRPARKDKRLPLREQYEAWLVPGVWPIAIVQHDFRVCAHRDSPTQLSGAFSDDVLTNDHAFRVIGEPLRCR